METEAFFGATLTKENPLAKFEIAEDEKVLADQKLIIKQIILGAEAKEDEFNVVQAETQIFEKKTLKIPIAVLKAGETRILKPNIEFPTSSVTFELIQGVGPVYIHGQHVVNDKEGDGDVEDFYYEDEDGEESDEEIAHRITQNTNGKKSNNHKRK